VVCYGRFVTICRVPSSNAEKFKNTEDGADRLSRNAGKKEPFYAV